ncbi:MAG: MotA/TolQ/ExbB proton channel family protein [Fibrobacter sp.]|nr:MotA/TolQ/ExbB proton channel family protein [Fibrobacter sp.]
MIEYFKLGGIFMWPILFSSIWAVALLIERALTYTKTRKILRKQAQSFFEIAEKQSLDAALRELDEYHGLLPDILRAAWDPQHPNVSIAERNVEEVLHQYKPALEKSLATLATLAAIQPLLGLLGTISGMIATFSVISSAGTGDPRALADGISEAMITTQAGLSVALPILLGHNFLRNRYRNILASLQQYCARALKDRERHGAE